MKNYYKSIIPFLALLTYPYTAYTNDPSGTASYKQEQKAPTPWNSSPPVPNTAIEALPGLSPIITINNEVHLPKEFINKNTNEVNIPMELFNNNSVQNTIEPTRTPIYPDVPIYLESKKEELPKNNDRYCVQDKQIQAHVNQTWEGLVLRKKLFTDPAKSASITKKYTKKYTKKATNLKAKKIIPSSNILAITKSEVICPEYPPFELIPHTQDATKSVLPEILNITPVPNPNIKSDAKLDAKLDAKFDAKLDAKPDAKLDTKSETILNTKPETTLEINATNNSEQTKNIAEPMDIIKAPSLKPKAPETISANDNNPANNSNANDFAAPSVIAPLRLL